MELSKYKQFLNGKHTKFEITDMRELLLETLKGRKWILDYKEDSYDPEMLQK